MEIRFNTTGPDRKRMVNTIAEALETKPAYLGAPSMAYRIGGYTVDRDGTLIFDDQADREELERVLESLLDAGFECEPWEPRPQQPAEPENKADSLTVTIVSVSSRSPCGNSQLNVSASCAKSTGIP